MGPRATGELTVAPWRCWLQTARVGGPCTALAVETALIAPVKGVSQRLVWAVIGQATPPPLGCGAPVPAAPGPWQPGCQCPRS